MPAILLIDLGDLLSSTVGNKSLPFDSALSNRMGLKDGMGLEELNGCVRNRVCQVLPVDRLMRARERAARGVSEAARGGPGRLGRGREVGAGCCDWGLRGGLIF